MISLILNSRKRPTMLLNFLYSVDKTISEKAKIEVIINVDEDDIETIDLISSVDFPFSIKPLIEKRTSNLMSRINKSAAESVGDYIFILNDDVQFETFDWDLKIKTDPNKIMYIATNDNSIDKEGSKSYSSFPILTRAAYNALGRFMSEEFVGLGADVHLWKIFNEVGRVEFCDINLDHIFHRTVTDVMSPDQTAQEMRVNSWNSGVDCWSVDISRDVERIRNEIESRML